MNKFVRVFLFGCFMSILNISQIQANQSIHSIWSELLGVHVSNGVVDYQGFKQSEARLDEYLQLLDETDPAKLERDAALALYINGYNACTVKLILDNFENEKPVSSIKKLGGFFSGPWKVKFCRIGGDVFTLDNIEHDIIRPKFQEPRVHFAVNCASKSCPPLISAAYEGESLDQQLEENTIRFIGDVRFNYFKENTLYVSKIFQWFSEDFNDDILGFIKRYVPQSVREAIASQKDSVKVKYLEYDWSLNGK